MRKILHSLLCVFAMSACSTSYFDVPGSSTSDAGGSKVTLDLSVELWNDAPTRAGGEIPAPVTLLLVPDGASNVVAKKVVEDDDYSIEVPYGDYDIFAVCGLPEDVVPDNLFDEIAIPLAEAVNGLTDFAVGSAAISNEYGKLSASTVAIAAKRQMVYLKVTVNDIPTNFTEIALYVKGQAEKYTLAENWSVSEEGKNKLTNLNLLKRAGKNFAVVDCVCIPCVDSKNGITFHVVAKTSDGKTLTYKYTSSTPVVMGDRFVLDLSISDLSLVNETVTVEDWNEKTENGTLTNPTVE